MYDEFAGRPVLAKPIPRRDGQAANDFKPRPLEDADIADALEWFQLGGMTTLSLEKMRTALDTFMHERGKFHPVRDYLGGLIWDGISRLDNLLTDYLGVVPTSPEHEKYVRAVGRNTLLAAVARIMFPGCKVDQVLILEGPQGTGKSTFVSILAGPWFTDTMPDLRSKDASDHLRGTWIVELPELSQLSKSRAEVEDIKAFLSRREEKFRPAYGRHEVIYARQNIFVGTTNADDYLRDATGNRRFLPVKIVQLDKAKLINDRDQLWAEAYEAVRLGEPWYMDASTEAFARQEQADRMADDPWSEKLQDYALGKSVINIGDFLTNQGVLPAQQGPHMKTIGGILKRMGWVNKKGRIGGVQARRWYAPGTEDAPFG